VNTHIFEGGIVLCVSYWAALGGHGSKDRCESVRDEQEGEEPFQWCHMPSQIAKKCAKWLVLSLCM
jgi:hypothetical protein